MAEVEYWTTHSLDKIFPQTERPPTAAFDVALKAAGNETEDFQIVLRPHAGITVHSIACSFSALQGTAKDHVLESDQFSAHWIWYTWVMHNPPHSKDPGSWLRNAPGFFPDGFLENSEHAINPEWTQPLWVSISVPDATPADSYTGAVTLTYTFTEGDAIWGGELPEKRKGEIAIPIRLEVWPFSLPRETTLHHTEWFFPLEIARYYHLEPWSEQHWQWIGKAARDMAAHYQNMILTDLFTLVRITARPENTAAEQPLSAADSVFDFSRLDRWIETFRNAGVPWIELGHVAERIGGWESAFGFKRLQPIDADGTILDLCSRDTLPESAYLPWMEIFLKAVYDHLKAKWGLERIVQHVADEPLDGNRDSWMRIARLVKEWIPDCIPTIDAAFSENLGDLVDIRVPQIQEIRHESRNSGPDSEKCLWSYVCLAPQGHHPNRFLDQRSVKNRILFWLSFSLKLEGFLHWGYNFWGSWCSLPDYVQISPWMDATAGSVYAHKRQPLPAGDPFIVYPGRDTICSSIRWEVLRKGFEDHKLLTMLAKAAAEDDAKSPAGKRAREILREIETVYAKDSMEYCREGEDLLALRNEIGELIARLNP